MAGWLAGLAGLGLACFFSARVSTVWLWGAAALPQPSPPPIIRERLCLLGVAWLWAAPREKAGEGATTTAPCVECCAVAVPSQHRSHPKGWAQCLGGANDVHGMTPRPTDVDVAQASDERTHDERHGPAGRAASFGVPSTVDVYRFRVFCFSASVATCRPSISRPFLRRTPSM